jgi:hypothetical protein
LRERAKPSRPSTDARAEPATVSTVLVASTSSACGSEKVPLTSLPVAVALGSAMLSAALPAVETTLAVVPAA